MKFKLDENLSPSLTKLFAAAGHDAMTVIEQSLGGQSDSRVLDVCQREQRAVVTHDLDLANIQLYPLAERSGMVVLRLNSQSHAAAVSAVSRMLELLQRESLAGSSWIVEDERIRVHA